MMDDDICSGAGTSEGEESADAAGGTCDQNGLAVEGIHPNSLYHFGIVKNNSDNFSPVLDFAFWR